MKKKLKIGDFVILEPTAKMDFYHIGRYEGMNGSKLVIRINKHNPSCFWMSTQEIDEDQIIKIL